MAEYTDREELRAAMQHIYNDPTCPMHISAEIEQIIDCAPAADVAPVVHGRWENGNPICPVCGEDKFKDLDADIWCDWLPPFCPRCGAKMDGGNQNV